MVELFSVNFTSQSTTAALLIENGSLFKGESEFEKLKIYLITLVSIRSDWEDLPWLFRSVENLPWRAILTMINQCLTGMTSGSDKPRHPVLQMLWGIVTQTNVDHAELLWEEFTQGIQTFFSHKASHEASLKDPKKKAVPLLIPYGRFTKMIIYYLGSTSDVHKRPESPCHLPGDDFLLGNLKFISKGETNEVFGMAIPKQLITQVIQQSSYYLKYLEMVAKNTKKIPPDNET
ncbi:hypothetical protein Tco_1552530 [Tanacetum coccineum]